MFPAAEHVTSSQSREKLARICHRFPRSCRDHARTHHAPRDIEGQIQHGSEVHVESQSAAVLTDDLPMLAEEFAIAGRENFRRRGRWSEHVAEAVDEAAFKIDAS